VRGSATHLCASPRQRATRSPYSLGSDWHCQGFPRAEVGEGRYDRRQAKEAVR
jgi:hypothetical protein